MGAMRWVVLVLVLGASCAKDLCENVECRRPASSVCLSETELQTGARVGTCEPATGECTFREPALSACTQGERCSEGACRCIPSECAGCCAVNGGCVQGTRLSAQACGLRGAECAPCAAGARCQQDEGCVACPAEHVVRFNECVDDDVGFEVALAGATRWPPPPFDGGITLWHLGPAGDVTADVVARSPRADVNGTGRPAVQLALSLAAGADTVEVEVRAPSGRTTRHLVTALATRAIAAHRFGGSCHVTSDGHLDCDGEVSDAGVFVGVGDGCGLTVDGTVWCSQGGGVWAQRFGKVAEVVDITLPCVLTRGGAATCEQQDGGLETQPGPWRSLECRTGACCGLEPGGTVLCWGSHEYNLFDPTNFITLPVYPAPRSVYGLLGRYVRLTSGTKTFFGMSAAGEWTAASNRMGFPGPAPFVIAEASATTFKLDSPYYCIMGLEADGGAWVREHGANTPFTPVDAGGGPFIDFTPHYSDRFSLLTTSHEVRQFTCP